MINRYVGDAPSRVIAADDHAAFIDILPEYVMQLVLCLLYTSRCV